MKKAIVNIANAPVPSGTYSPAIRAGNTIYLAGQIPLLPTTGEMVGDDIGQQINQVFQNMQAVCQAAGGSLADIVKLNIYLTELSDFPYVNQVMAKFFSQPYPARTTVEVSALPKGAKIEIDAIMILS